jgi:GNAT superfamily N-acetyltransferase
LSYTIREVDGVDNDDILTELHGKFFHESVLVDFGIGYWWLAYYEKEPIAFAGLSPSQLGFNCGYLKRCGVLPEHQGNGLQRRLIRVRESKAKRLGWARLVTDTTDNPQSSNSLYRAGFKMFAPAWPWAFDNTLYWTKTL